MKSVTRDSGETVDQPASTLMETTANSSTVTAESSTGLLLPVVLAIAFVCVCAAAAIVWFRAAVRRGVLFDQLSERVRQLEEELADRDGKIERLTSRLTEDSQAFNQTQPIDNVEDTHGDEESRNSKESQPAHDELPNECSDFQPRTEQVAEPLAEARSSLKAAREQLDRHMQQHLLDPDAIADQLSAGPIAFAAAPDASATAPETCNIALPKESDLIRSEFSDLFEIHNATNGESTVTEPSVPTTADENFVSEAQRENEAHVNSVNDYLTHLLERSKDAGSQEAILVNRRKAENSYRGPDRRSSSEPPRKSVVSFLDSYLQAHGGELAAAVERPVVAVEVEQPVAPATPAALPRKPIDVESIRKSMTSFRAVAIQYVEDAVSTHNVRQAKGKIAVRSMWIWIVFLISALVIVTNVAQAIRFSTLSWLLVSGVALSIAELGLRMQQIRKQRKIKASVISQLVATKRPGPVLQTDDDYDDQVILTQVAEPASSRVSPQIAAEHPLMAN